MDDPYSIAGVPYVLDQREKRVIQELDKLFRDEDDWTEDQKQGLLGSEDEDPTARSTIEL